MGAVTERLSNSSRALCSYTQVYWGTLLCLVSISPLQNRCCFKIFMSLTFHVSLGTEIVKGEEAPSCIASPSFHSRVLYSAAPLNTALPESSCLSLVGTYTFGMLKLTLCSQIPLRNSSVHKFPTLFCQCVSIFIDTR